MELQKGNKNESLIFFQKALSIADSTGNKQAIVSCLSGLSDWALDQKDQMKAEYYVTEAKRVANGLSDKSFYLRVLGQLAALKKRQGKFHETVVLQEEINRVNDTLNTWEKQRIVKSLEVQFDVLEKDKKIKLMQQENELSRLTNLFLISLMAFISLLAIAIVVFLRRINIRNQQLLKTKEALAQSAEEQKRLKEQQLQNEIEFKESQLTAMTLQMLQKNELMSELKTKYEEVPNTNRDSGVEKIINKAMIQEKDWVDFNLHFESMNRNFYSRLKEDYPEISPNDLKICALIKLNLSIKEMAGILNISPDSVKTARYRLRKKLGLHTEDNLTDFILNL
jgi:DNA-binding CsgD family transcriptional regulator